MFETKKEGAVNKSADILFEEMASYYKLLDINFKNKIFIQNIIIMNGKEL